MSTTAKLLLLQLLLLQIHFCSSRGSSLPAEKDAHGCLHLRGGDGGRTERGGKAEERLGTRVAEGGHAGEGHGGAGGRKGGNGGTEGGGGETRAPRKPTKKKSNATILGQNAILSVQLGPTWKSGSHASKRREEAAGMEKKFQMAQAESGRYLEDHAKWGSRGAGGGGTDAHHPKKKSGGGATRAPLSAALQLTIALFLAFTLGV